jgi:hypothetical protein
MQKCPFAAAAVAVVVDVAEIETEAETGACCSNAGGYIGIDCGCEGPVEFVEAAVGVVVAVVHVAVVEKEDVVIYLDIVVAGTLSAVEMAAVIGIVFAFVGMDAAAEVVVVVGTAAVCKRTLRLQGPLQCFDLVYAAGDCTNAVDQFAALLLRAHWQM